MTGVIDLNDVQGTDSGTSGSDSDDGGDHGDLKEAVESVGGDFEHAKLYVEQTDQDPEVLIDFIAGLDDDLMQLHETYRQSSDIKRIDLNWLRNDDGRSYSAYRGAFYGDSDDPAEGTHNAIAQQARANDAANLMWYRAVFPEPQTDFWDSDAVRWHEFDDIGYDDGEQDSHIYVTRDFVEEYGDFTIEVDGEERPRPPTDSEIGGASSSSDAPIDPSDFTVEELRDEVQEGIGSWSESDFEAVLEAEEGSKDRTTAKKAITGAMNEADFGGGEQADLESALEEADLSESEVVEAIQSLAE